jgi:hypothetical protein
MVERDLADVVRAMSGDELRDTRRDLAVSTSLMRSGSPMHGPATAYLSAVETELAERTGRKSSEHAITPRLGTMRHAATGKRTDGMHPIQDYPMAAICLECGQDIRLDKYFFAEWYHAAS